MSSFLTTKEIIHLHKNPTKPIGTFGKKLFLPEDSEKEATDVKQALESLKTLLKAERVDRRHARLEAEWIPEKKYAKVTRRSGHIPAHIGRDIKGEFILSPEEALFLLEMNRLELLQNGVPFSIEQGYATLLDSEGSSLDQYRVYQALSSQGFHVKTWQPDCKTKSKIRNLNQTKYSEIKRFRIKAKRKMRIAGVPVPEKEKFENDMPYFIHAPNSSGGMRIKHGINIQSGSNEIWKGNISTEKYSVINALSGVDSVAFYQLQTINFDIKKDEEEK